MERKQVVDDASSTDVDEIYRLKEEKKRKDSTPYNLFRKLHIRRLCEQ